MTKTTYMSYNMYIYAKVYYMVIKFCVLWCYVKQSKLIYKSVYMLFSQLIYLKNKIGRWQILLEFFLDE